MGRAPGVRGSRLPGMVYKSRAEGQAAYDRAHRERIAVVTGVIGAITGILALVVSIVALLRT